MLMPGFKYVIAYCYKLDEDNYQFTIKDKINKIVIADENSIFISKLDKLLNEYYLFCSVV